MAKTILRDSIVIDMIVTTVVGENARSLYTPKPTEWANGTKSDIVYTASVTSSELPPVLIEVQHTINLDFIDRLLGYSLFAKKEYKAKPIVVVFGTYATRNEISSDFEVTSFSFMKQIPCKYWAEKCYILDQNTFMEATKTVPLPPLAAIAYFFSSKKLSLLASEYRDDPTLQTLYAIAKEQTVTKVAAEQSTSEVLLEVCNQTNLQFKKILNTLEPMPDTLLKKRLRAYADDGALYTQTCKYKYTTKRNKEFVESMPPPPELSDLAKSMMNESSSSIDILREEISIPKTDMEYVKQFKQNESRMDWKTCYEAGKSEGFFSSYSSSSSLKTAFYKTLSKND
ncbi:hypothetical protein CU098_009168 [Rhizopus stolonifer]|uniref:Uncharacterized protein n=1 Tax=Rhizopus stolonifer TaxID=4846 RepID=A0A367JEU3_RHIST|nr:hypothetical protein CU098_009168 [Rhizopus stolonifer]